MPYNRALDTDLLLVVWSVSYETFSSNH